MSDSSQKASKDSNLTGNPSPTSPKCGIVMPISATEDCDASHWSEVKEIIIEAITKAGFDGSLVSDAYESGTILKRIIQNLYSNDVVVCDVSCKNPNVMFELGLRLAFDKPTILIKDDVTNYAFDVSSIEHLEYPRDLSYYRILKFKDSLIEKIKATHDKAKSDPNYTTFLKHFGEFKVAKIDKREVSSEEYIIDELKSIKFEMRRMYRDVEYKSRRRYIHDTDEQSLCLENLSISQIKELSSKIKELFPDSQFKINELNENHYHISLDSRYPITIIKDLIKSVGSTDYY